MKGDRVKKKILTISRGSTFMIGAICTNLEEAGFSVIKTDATVKGIQQTGEDADVILFYLGSYIEEIPDVLVYLKDFVLEHEKLLCIVADDQETALLNRSVPADLVAERFDRPLDIHRLVEGIERLVEMSDERSAKKSILLVDDDSTFLRMMRDWLMTSYRVTVVSSGMQAITYLATNKPDLILLDYEMPVTSGPQVLEMIKTESATSNIPVIFLTAKGDKDSVMKVLALKPEGYLLKSAGRDEILKMINDFFEQRRIKKFI